MRRSHSRGGLPLPLRTSGRLHTGRSGDLWRGAQAPLSLHGVSARLFHRRNRRSHRGSRGYDLRGRVVQPVWHRMHIGYDVLSTGLGGGDYLLRREIDRESGHGIEWVYGTAAFVTIGSGPSSSCCYGKVMS